MNTKRPCSQWLCAAIAVTVFGLVSAAERLPFDQDPPQGSPAVFAPGIVSLAGRYEYALSFSPEGDELFFTVEPPGGRAAVYHSRRTGASWSEPVKVSLSEGARPAEMEAFFSPDGRRVHFAAYDKGMDVRLWAIERDGDGWSSPRPLGGPVSDVPAFFPTMASDGTLYYSDLAARQVARATFSGSEVASAEPAGIAFGGHPFVAPSGEFVLLDAPALVGGKRDIFVAFSDDDGMWTEPVPLGGAVNSEFSETCPTLSADGAYLFFSRYDEPQGISNIYWIGADVISAARARVDRRSTDLQAIENAIEDTFLWAQEKDRARLEKVIAKDEDYFSWHPRGMEPVVGYERFQRGFDTWLDPRFEATTFDMRELRINLSRTGTVAWFSAVIDDCYEWDGEPGCWKDTRWTGVLELRGEQWTMVQMHFSFPADRDENPAP